MRENYELQELAIEKQGSINNSFNQNRQKSRILSLADVTEPIIGMCQQFISKKQINARQLSDYQKPNAEYKNWQPMALHFRNIQYTNENVRTPETLSNCLDFICAEYLPYYQKVFDDQEQRTRFQCFLYDRIRSIRCQLFVQGKFQPKVQMKLVKILLFLETMIGQPVEITGIEYFLSPEIKQILLTDQSLKPYFYEALEYAIFIARKQKLLVLLNDHSNQICQSQKLTLILHRRLKMLNNNYMCYLMTLAKYDNIYVRLILWSQVKGIQALIIDLYKIAKMNEKASILCKFLGYQKIDGWMTISEFLKSDRKVAVDLEIKLWVRQHELMEALDELEVPLF